jgi:tetratricopeptide (TPR) repeat protein
MADTIDRGIVLLRNAARSKPGDPKICIDLMVACCRKNQTKEAVSEFVMFVKRCPESTQLHHDMLLDVSRGEGLANEIFQGFQQAVKQPADADAYLVHYGLGLLYAALGMHDNAIPVFEESIRRNSEYAPAYHNLGLSYHYSRVLVDDTERRRRTEKAIIACQTAIKKCPTLAEAHYFLGISAMSDNGLLALSYLRNFVRLAKPYLANHVPGAQQCIQLLEEKLRRTP